ncbi:uncharacterized protein LOC144128540 isoform X1 [Amblyomma americanum]
MASAASRSVQSAPGTGAGPKDEDTKKPVSDGCGELLGSCNLSASSSDSDESSSSGSSSCSGSSSGSSSDSSSDEEDGSASETVDVVGEDAPTASPSIEGFQNAASPQPSSTQADEGTDADPEKQVSVGGASSVPLEPAVRVPQLTLVNKAVFSPKMELQVSPQGRLMQPAPIVCFTNLIDELQYVVWVSFIQDSGICAGEYMHPESPRPGTSWNGKPLSFSKLKLYTYNGTSKTPITLICNKNYFLQINFGNVNEHGHILASTVIRQAIIGTWFVAVNHSHTKALASSRKKPSLAKALALSSKKSSPTKALPSSNKKPTHAHMPANKRHKSNRTSRGFFVS